MLLSALYALTCLLLDLVRLGCRGNAARDIELLVLRHEVRILRRRVKRVHYDPGDRLVLAGLTRDFFGASAAFTVIGRPAPVPRPDPIEARRHARPE